MDQNIATTQDRPELATADQGSLLMAIVGGLAGALIGAAIWGGVTYATNYQIGWLAIGVGFLCGFGVRQLGKGAGMPYHAIGALTALVGVVVGNVFTIELSVHHELNIWVGSDMVVELMKRSFTPIDVLFYGLALWFGWKYAAKVD